MRKKCYMDSALLNSEVTIPGMMKRFLKDP